MINPHSKAIAKILRTVCCAVVLLVSCTEEADMTASGLKLDESSLILFPGQTHSFKVATLSGSSNVPKLVWESTDPEVASVEQNGTLSALSVGNTVVKANSSDGRQLAECKVYVMEKLVSVESVSFDQETMTMLLRETGGLVATVSPEDASVKELVWASSNPEVAEVSVDGKLIAKGMGQSVITATSVEGKKTARCVVTVDALQFDITFETNGGTKVPPQRIVEGERATEPQTVKSMDGGLGTGLYEGVQNPDQASYSFLGWYTDSECTKEYSFGAPVYKDLVLYAKWSSPTQVDIASASGDIEALKAINYLNALALEVPGVFTLVMDADVDNKSFKLNNENVSLHIVGKGKSVGLLATTYDINVVQATKGHIFLGNNIHVTTKNNKSSRPVLMDGGNVTMLPGSKVKDCVVGNQAWGSRSVVYVNNDNSVFTLDGGEIVGNKYHCSVSDYFATIVAANKGKIVIKSGRIAGNQVMTDIGGIGLSGALYGPEVATIEKTGGVIENNTVEPTQKAVDSGTELRHSGKAVVYRAPSQYNSDSGTPGYRGAHKIDANLSETDSFTTKDLSNPLWVRLNYKD